MATSAGGCVVAVAMGAVIAAGTVCVIALGCRALSDATHKGVRCVVTEVVSLIR